MPIWLSILLILAGAGAGIFGGYLYRKEGVEKKIGRTEEYAKRLYDDAVRKADDYKKEKVLEAKEEILKVKAENDPVFQTGNDEVAHVQTVDSGARHQCDNSNDDDDRQYTLFHLYPPCDKGLCTTCSLYCIIRRMSNKCHQQKGRCENSVLFITQIIQPGIFPVCRDLP